MGRPDRPGAQSKRRHRAGLRLPGLLRETGAEAAGRTGQSPLPPDGSSQPGQALGSQQENLSQGQWGLQEEKSSWFAVPKYKCLITEKSDTWCLCHVVKNIQTAYCLSRTETRGPALGVRTPHRGSARAALCGPQRPPVRVAPWALALPTLAPGQLPHSIWHRTEQGFRLRSRAAPPHGPTSTTQLPLGAAPASLPCETPLPSAPELTRTPQSRPALETSCTRRRTGFWGQKSIQTHNANGSLLRPSSARGCGAGLAPRLRETAAVSGDERASRPGSGHEGRPSLVATKPRSPQRPRERGGSLGWGPGHPLAAR